MQRKTGVVNNWRGDSSVAWRKQRYYQNVQTQARELNISLYKNTNRKQGKMSNTKW